MRGYEKAFGRLRDQQKRPSDRLTPKPNQLETLELEGSAKKLGPGPALNPASTAKWKVSVQRAAKLTLAFTLGFLCSELWQSFSRFDELAPIAKMQSAPSGQSVMSHVQVDSPIAVTKNHEESSKSANHPKQTSVGLGTPEDAGTTFPRSILQSSIVGEAATPIDIRESANENFEAVERLNVTGVTSAEGDGRPSAVDKTKIFVSDLSTRDEARGVGKPVKGIPYTSVKVENAEYTNVTSDPRIPGKKHESLGADVQAKMADVTEVNSDAPSDSVERESSAKIESPAASNELGIGAAKNTVEPISDKFADSYALQLVAFLDSNRITPAWKGLQEEHPSLLSNLELQVEMAEVNGKNYHRVLAGPVTGRSRAEELCNRLKARNQDCLVRLLPE